MSGQNPLSADRVGLVSQLIVSAFIVGVVMFAVLGFFFYAKDSERPKNAPLGIEYIGAGMGVVQIALSMFVPGLISQAALRRLAATPPDDWRKALAPVYLTNTIVRNAFLEGGGLFNGAVFMITHSLISPAVMGVLIALMAITFPSQVKFESWAQQVQRDHS